MKIAILVGTRPEVIKMAPVIRECQNRNLNFILIHSNQHYSDVMDAVFFKELNLPTPHYNLNVGSGAHSNQIGNILIKLEPILKDEGVNVLLVQGDTNTVAAGALSASKLGIKVGHVEAGLRSYDRTMPEEGNRVITDHISDYLFAVSDTQVNILKSEGISAKKIFRVGNTIVDAVFQNVGLANEKSTILKQLSLTEKNYTLFTAHRASNVDKESDLKEVMNILEHIEGSVVWPIHLRTKKNLEQFNIQLPKNVISTDPLGFFDFLNLEQHAKLVVTDSGGLQEEACILGVPCITIRENTERPETIDVGANQLVGKSLAKFKKAYSSLPSSWKNPFGEGNTAKMILDIVSSDFGVVTAVVPKTETISVVGMGYMGIPTAALLATAGYKVCGIDINKEKVELLNKGIVPFDEPGMSKLVKDAVTSTNFTASVNYRASDIYIVAVPTPHDNGKCDLSYVLAACREIAKHAQNGNMIIIESTIKPGTCANYVDPIFKEAGLNVHVVHCPERAIPGNTLHELVYNDRIVGGLTPEATDIAFKIYKSFCKGEMFKTKAINAECAKLMENTYRDVNIALANELSMIAEDIGFDVEESIALANRHPRVNILSPGPGVGGHCIPIDPWFLTEDTKNAKLIETARRVNDEKPHWIVNKLLKSMELKNKKVALLGVAYKPNVDDSRETPASEIYKLLIESGVSVKCHDPLVHKWEVDLYKFEDLRDWADCFLIVTQHDDFKKYDFDSKELVICK